MESRRNKRRKELKNGSVVSKTVLIRMPGDEKKREKILKERKKK